MPKGFQNRGGGRAASPAQLVHKDASRTKPDVQRPLPILKDEGYREKDLLHAYSCFSASSP